MSDEGGVAAVDRALSILDALTEEKVTLAELFQLTLTRSSARQSRAAWTAQFASGKTEYYLRSQ